MRIFNWESSGEEEEGGFCSLECSFCGVGRKSRKIGMWKWAEIWKGEPGFEFQLGIPGFEFPLGIPGFQFLLGIPGFEFPMGIPGFEFPLGIPGFEFLLGILGFEFPLGILGFQFLLGIPDFEFLLGIPWSSLNPSEIHVVATKRSREMGKFEAENVDLMYKETQLDPCGERRGGNGNLGGLDGKEPGNCGVDF